MLYYEDIIRMMRDMAKCEALAKIARNQAYNAEIGRRKHDAARDKMAAIRNEYNIRRIQIENKELTLWWRRHRTCK